MTQHDLHLWRLLGKFSDCAGSHHEWAWLIAPSVRLADFPSAVTLCSGVTVMADFI
jgi:hypothetical protein